MAKNGEHGVGVTNMGGRKLKMFQNGGRWQNVQNGGSAKCPKWGIKMPKMGGEKSK